MKQEPAEATMRNGHGSAVGILAINGEDDVKSRRFQKLWSFRSFLRKQHDCKNHHERH
jgi:hypothetical protein